MGVNREAVSNSSKNSKGNVNAALDPFLKASRDLRAILLVLGLKRHAKQVTLQDVLEGDTR